MAEKKVAHPLNPLTEIVQTTIPGSHEKIRKIFEEKDPRRFVFVSKEQAEELAGLSKDPLLIFVLPE
jgi:hypothetical protein